MKSPTTVFGAPAPLVLYWS